MNAKIRLWVPGDWNALFGFGTNILVNLLTLTSLLRFVLKMPDTLVFGRILPATGLMMCLSTMYYAYLAYRLAKQTGRNDVCALPSGISVPHMFIVTFVVMLPIALSTKDPMKGWEAGLTWVFVQSFVLMVGGFHRAHHPQDHTARRAVGNAGGRLHYVHLHGAGSANVHDAGDRHHLLRHHSAELVRRREVWKDPSWVSGDRGRLADRVGIDRRGVEFRRDDWVGFGRVRHELRLSRSRAGVCERL